MSGRTPSLNPETFDQASYWLKRHERLRGDRRSIGREDYDEAANDLADQQFAYRLTKALEWIPAPRTVLDVGCGYGRAAPLFLDRGCDYTGIDISPLAIDDARASAEAGKFLVADLNDWNTDDRFDLVAVMFVFIHFVDDAAWLSLLERCLSWVAPGGSMLFADLFPRMVERSAEHTKTRPISEYHHVLAKHGFRLDRGFELHVADPGMPTHSRLAVRQPQ